MSSGERSARCVLAELLPQVRARADLSAQQLADRVSAIGGKLDRAAISKIESRTRNVSLDEALLLAVALDVAPVHLFIPRDNDDTIELAPALAAPDAARAREWFRGHEQLPLQNEKTYRTEVPDSEWEAARQPSRRELDAANAWESARRRLKVAERVVSMLKREIDGLDDPAANVRRIAEGRRARQASTRDPERDDLRAELRTARAEVAEAEVDLEDAARAFRQIRSERESAAEMMSGGIGDGEH